jgi:ribosomal protein S18 acetylase RimI-like enzyme
MDRNTPKNHKDESGVSAKMAFQTPDVHVAAAYVVSAAVAPIAKRLGFGRK